MSATINDDAVKAVSNQEGQIGSHVPPSEPLEKGGHKPGVLATKADKAPEFHAQTLPAGSAPASHTHIPNPTTSSLPPDTTTTTSASDTLLGATSADVYTGLGHPGQGQTSTELRHDGSHGRAKQGTGLVGVGADTVTNKGSAVDAHDPGYASQRALDKDVETGARGTVGGPPAEERLPEGAETVASEAPKDRATSGVASALAGSK
ncbi:uncharacterized protein LTHEOB_5268 [Lasiodiplodia theobromae]|uniref:Uncharacterized protein n=1 Tax=Lasiodiplodia theobromae TaxID=45133 RepID=A0A5N5CV62_9PEZI|nr:uncharacterized protein LTHEOB_5268 [Lasiodiplodia theobromae]KAB2569237.1 hypothetical protein DBV05_g12081 [Lasiodiplodia theobromae]KAF4545435.1 hypothetical protein LTHEOB_5268 [Lasiodiplodia theobromae]